MKKEHEVRITVRFPQELIDELKALRVQYGPSLNSEIVQAVREYVARKKGENKRAEKL
jgi:metal-responsive CopG/Arc/MetJ family transcriptional regulator